MAYATILSLRSGLPHDTFGQGEAMALGPLDRYIAIELVDNVLTFIDDRSETTTFDIRTRKITPLPVRVRLSVCVSLSPEACTAPTIE